MWLWSDFMIYSAFPPVSTVRHDNIMGPTVDPAFPLPSRPYCVANILAEILFTYCQGSVHANSGHVGGVGDTAGHWVIQHNGPRIAMIMSLASIAFLT